MSDHAEWSITLANMRWFYSNTYDGWEKVTLLLHLHSSTYTDKSLMMSQKSLTMCHNQIDCGCILTLLNMAMNVYCAKLWWNTLLCAYRLLYNSYNTCQIGLSNTILGIWLQVSAKNHCRYHDKLYCYHDITLSLLSHSSITNPLP